MCFPDVLFSDISSFTRTKNSFLFSENLFANLGAGYLFSLLFVYFAVKTGCVFVFSFRDKMTSIREEGLFLHSSTLVRWCNAPAKFGTCFTERDRFSSATQRLTKIDITFREAKG